MSEWAKSGSGRTGIGTAIQGEIDKKLLNKRLIQLKELIGESLQYIRGENSRPALTEGLEVRIFAEPK